MKDLFLDLALVFEISSDAPAPDLPQTGGQLLYSLLGILLCLLLALLADMHSRRRRRMRTSG